MGLLEIIVMLVIFAFIASFFGAESRDPGCACFGTIVFILLVIGMIATM